MIFISDFHVHSKYSRATARNLDLENLYIAAQLKGITVVGTGDFTNPEWFSELREKLIITENGLYKLKPEISKKCDEQIPASCRSKVAFLPTAEISNIYKKNGKTRKNHNLIFMPDLDAAARFNARLSAIGNLESDGRPILGLDAKNLLEIMLETTERAFYVPAHIWTPWFSMLGSKSGFDSVEECFEDLTSNIHAVETGLSSDPPMNRCVSNLDGITLISNSDAHSPSNLGREANIFDGTPGYDFIIDAMKTGDPGRFLGTIEFYPEEGKYHYDGHRKCDVRFTPEQSLSHAGLCPVCGKSLTLGVLYRVNELSDHSEGRKKKDRQTFQHIIPLTHILSEMLRVGPKTKRVLGQYHTILNRLGPELNVLREISMEKIRRASIPLLAEAIERMRKKQIRILPGYDGEFGCVRIFEDGERESLLAQKRIFPNLPKKNPEKDPPDYPTIGVHPRKTSERSKPYFSASNAENPKSENDLNDEQKEAVRNTADALLIVAGPGTGKTRTLTCRIAYLISERKISPETMLAVTFTNKSAEEMKNRLKRLLGEKTELPALGTFHAVCLNILKNLYPGRSFSLVEDKDRLFFVSEAIRMIKAQDLENSMKPAAVLEAIVKAKQDLCGLEENLSPYLNEWREEIFREVYRRYQEFLRKQRLLDFEDLLFKVLKLFESDSAILNRYRKKFRFIFVDEYQDLNHSQYRLIRALAPPFSANGPFKRGLFAIGDPDQSIYGFRGSDVRFFQRFVRDYSGAKVIYLNKNYRSSDTILSASHQVIQEHRIGKETPRVYSGIQSAPELRIIESPSEKAEAEKIARTIEKLVGGTGFFSIDSGRSRGGGVKTDRSFSDFAVLYRIREQGKLLEKAFDKMGIPCQLVGREKLFGNEGVRELISFFKLIHTEGVYSDLLRALTAVSGRTVATALNDLWKWGWDQEFSVGELLENIESVPGEILSDEKRRTISEFTEYLTRIRSEIKKGSKNLTVKMQLNHLSKQTPLKTLFFQNAANTEALNKTLDFSTQFRNNTEDFLSSVALQTDPDVYSSRAEKVSLMTMHAAKGLEFPVVFIAGCEDGLIPYVRKNRSIDAEEERRLFYVAMTRAKESLYLTWSRKRIIFGKRTIQKISPFVDDIENELKKHEKSPDFKKQKSSQLQLQLF